jgi:DNA invertase Pin-like site-specific DNA recombinase
MGAKCLPIQSKNRWSAKEPHAAASSRKNRAKPSGRIRALRVPAGKIIKAQAMVIEGHSQREIGRILHMSGHTVAEIIKSEDFVRHIKCLNHDRGIASRCKMQILAVLVP